MLHGNDDFARELARPNRVEWAARVLSVLGPLGVVAGWSVLVSKEHGFEPAFSGTFGSLLVTVSAPITALVLRSQRTTIVRMLAGKELLARWRCVARLLAPQRRARARKRALTAGLMALICAILWLTAGPWFSLMFTTILALTLLGMTYGLQSHRSTAITGEVWIAREAMLLDGELVAWTGASQLDSIALERRDGKASIVFAVSVRGGRHGRQRFEFRAPVPAAERAAADEVVRTLRPMCSNDPRS